MDPFRVSFRDSCGKGGHRNPSPLQWKLLDFRNDLDIASLRREIQVSYIRQANFLRLLLSAVNRCVWDTFAYLCKPILPLLISMATLHVLGILGFMLPLGAIHLLRLHRRGEGGFTNCPKMRMTLTDRLREMRTKGGRGSKIPKILRT